LKIKTSLSAFILLILLFSITSSAITIYSLQSKQPLIPSDHQPRPSGQYSKDLYNITLNTSSFIISNCKNTGSMYPTIGDNTSIILDTSINLRDTQPGDIISFSSNDKQILHRIISLNTDSKGLYAITKGDNNDVTDFKAHGKIRPEQVRGVLIAIIY